MPAVRKKRTVAKNGKAKRDKNKLPTLPEGEFDTSMNAEEQQSKLNDYISDYQMQVGRRLDRMRKYVQQIKGHITHCYSSAIVGLVSVSMDESQFVLVNILSKVEHGFKPEKSVREMTMEEFMRRGGKVDLAFNAEVHAAVTDLAMPTKSSTRLPLTGISNGIELSGLNLLQPSMPLSQLASNVQTAGKSTRKRKGKMDIKPLGSAATRSSRRLQAKTSVNPNNEATPMPNPNVLRVLNHGMFITPKFDPRLPVPDKDVRNPKAGERMISMDGSPLANPLTRPTPQAIIPLAGGKTMQLSVDDKQTTNEEEMDVANDTVAQQNIKLLQEKLSKLLKMPKNME